VLKESDIPREITEVLGSRHSERINTMVKSIVDTSYDQPFVAMSDEVGKATNDLRSFLFENVYRNPTAKSEEAKAQEMLIKLFEHYVKNPDKMPESYRRNIESEGVERCVCDFVSGMTDRYAIETYSDLFIPKVWRGRS
jgi:dGTPase